MARIIASFQFLLLLLSGLAVSPAAADAGRPQRIVSMNQCTDLLLLLLVDPERIASISFVSGQPQWTPPEYAGVIARLPSNRGMAEEVLALKGDLVVTESFNNRQTVQLLRRLGYSVAEFDAETGFNNIRANILRMGDLVGEPARAQAIVAAFDARLASLRTKAGTKGGVFADVGVNGWMSGEGTLMADVANAAGYRTLGQTMGAAGFRNLSLDQIIAAKPDMIALSNAWTSPPSEATNALRHPAFRELARTAIMVDIPDRLTICGSPATLDAVELIEKARR
jgi:iron complex transport system substrate-binding protein